jgi:protein ImuA
MARAAVGLEELRKVILPLQGLSHKPGRAVMNMHWGAIANAFPKKTFPIGAMHEMITNSAADAAATAGFISCIAGALMQDGGAAIWIGTQRDIFPAALAQFNIAPHHLIFIQLKKEKELLWASEEALKCNGVAAVITEIDHLNFMQSRRLQLAVEESAVTGFIFRRSQKNIQTTACVSRWKISAAKTNLENNLPGIGYPAWQIDLLKMRGGSTGSWMIEWRNGRLHAVENNSSIIIHENRKAG